MKGAKIITPSASDQTIPAGYHNGSGKVSAVSVPAANVLTGTTIAGTAGTMENQGSKVITPSTTNQAIAKGYHDGTGYAKGDTNLIPANILNGKSIFGVNGSLDPGKKYFYKAGVGQSQYVNLDFGFAASILLIKSSTDHMVAFDSNGLSVYGKSGNGLSNIQYSNIKWSNGKMAGIQNYLIGDKVSYTIEAWE